MKKEMLINVLQPEECRIAILENGVLEELYVERTSHECYVGNIYKGRVVNIEPSIQAAFVDFGVGRNGFLHVSDVEPAYYKHLQENGRSSSGSGQRGGRRSSTRVSRPGIVIPSHKQNSSDDVVDEIEEVDELDDDFFPVAALPVNLGATEEITIVDEMLVDDADDWSDESSLSSEASEEDGDEIEGFSENAEAAIITATEPEDDDTESSVVEEENEKTFDASNEDEEQAISLEDFDNTSREDKSEDDANPQDDLNNEIETPTDDAENLVSDSEAETDSDNVEAEVVEEKPKPKRKTRTTKTRKGRGTSSRKKSKTSDSDTDGSSSEEDGNNEDKSNDVDAETETDKDTDGPKPMESAERRTHEEDEPDDDSISRESEYEHDDEVSVSSDDSAANVNDLSDEDLSFSMRSKPTVEVKSDERSPDEDDVDEEEMVTEFQSETSYSQSDDDIFGNEISTTVADTRPNYATNDRYENGGHARQGQRNDRNDRRGRGGRSGGSSSGPGRRTPRNPTGRPKPLIQDIFKRGQEVLVQVIKEGIGTKGPTLSTYISIAGRYLVLMPGLNRIGVSRKITDEEQRRRLRDILCDLKPPKGLGFIIRTAGLDRTKRELQRDLAYLSRLWQVVVRRIKKIKSPAEIYQESDMITRTIRDTFTSEIQTIWVDEQKAFEHAQEFLQIVMPRYASRIKHFKDAVPIFHRHKIEEEISRIHQRHVPLPNGGSIVIDQTEALVAIDVNSGNFRADNNAEETAYQMNLIAAREIARQLRLRDLGGVIVNDFIDMREERHRRNVERALRDAVRRDRARTKVLKISSFGIIEMTRQRIRPSLKRSVYKDCPHCSGSGQIKTCESMSIDVMRMLQLAATRDNITQIIVHVHDEVCSYLHNRKRKEIVWIEEQTNTSVIINGVACASPEHLEFVCYDANNNEIRFPPFEEPAPKRRN